MQTTLQDVNINTSSGEIFIRITNIGDEPAKDVSLVAISKHIQAEEQFIGDLPTNSPLKLNISFTFLPTLKGSYPFYIMLKYKDINGYPFSVITPGRINYLERTDSNIYASMHNIDLHESTTLNLLIRNIGSEAYNVNADLYLPRELVTESLARTTLIEPKTEVKYSFLIRNFNALEASKYAVFAAVEYESDNKHYSTIARNIITITSADENSLLIYALATLIILIVLFIYIRRREHESQGQDKHNNSDTE
jgi:hypothetical protein